MDQQPLSKLARFKAWHTRTWSAGWMGKAKIIVLWYMVIMLCAAILLGEKRMPTDGTLVSSDTEVVTRQVLTTSNGARAIAQRTLHDVYDLAQQKPQLQSVRMEFVMSSAGVKDQYGNPIKEDKPMGKFEWSAGELAEARKYRAFHLWADDRTITLYGAMLKQMPSGHLLRDY